MQNVVLIIHLVLAVLLIAVVLLQRSEGGALGIGGGGGGMVSARGAGSALSKLTWALAGGFILTSITLTILAGGRQDTGSVLDRIGVESDGTIPLPAPAAPEAGGSLTPPPATPPATPPAAD
jgi:preprotein translocase subunit SecG